MMIEQATVIGYQNGIATLQCQAKQGCGSCAAQSSCGTKALSALSGEKHAPQFQLAVPQALAVGDRVEIGLSERSLLGGVLWLYGLPLLSLIASALLASHWIAHELGVALVILLVTISSFFAVQKIIARKPQQAFTPIFLRKI